MQYDTLMLGSGLKPQLPVSHKIMSVNNQYSTVHCVARVFWILYYVFSYPIMPTKCLSVYPISGERRKAITREIKLKITTQL